MPTACRRVGSVLAQAGDRAGAANRTSSPQLGDAPLGEGRAGSALDARAARCAQVEGGDVALKAAIAAFKAGALRRRRSSPLEAALATEPAGLRAASMHYYIGVVAAKAGELDKAIAQLQLALAGDVAEEDARFQLASALDRKGDFPKARGEYDRFATAHPQSPLAAYAMRRSATLARMPASAFAAPAAQPAASPVVAPKPTPMPVVKPVVPAVERSRRTRLRPASSTRAAPVPAAAARRRRRRRPPTPEL